MSIVWTILMLGVMVFVHELGHYMTAKSFNVKVHEFAIGMGPAILKWGKGETKYSVRILPIGGFCKMEGEDEDSTDPRSLGAIHPYKKIIILVAGAAMNVLLAFILYLYLNAAMPVYTSTSIADFMDNSPLATAGLQQGDEIVKLNNSDINIFSDIGLFMSANQGEPVDVTVKRGSEKLTKTITPVMAEGAYKLGFLASKSDNTIPATIRNSVYDTAFGVRYIYWSLGQLLSGKVQLRDVTGVVGMVNVVGDVVKAGESLWIAFLNVISLAALICINLGVINLLPLPALDGGRVVFAVLEWIRGKKVKPEVEGYFHMVGLILLFLLMVAVTGSDIMKMVFKG